MPTWKQLEVLDLAHEQQAGHKTGNLLSPKVLKQNPATHQYTITGIRLLKSRGKHWLSTKYR